MSSYASESKRYVPLINHVRELGLNHTHDALSPQTLRRPSTEEGTNYIQFPSSRAGGAFGLTDTLECGTPM